MKNFKIDTVQVIGVLGGVFAVAGSMLTNYANEKKLDGAIDTKVQEAINKHLAELLSKGE